jgi:hypothetical protein
MMSRKFDIIDDFSCVRAHIILILTSLPTFITTVFRGMPGVWKRQHRLLLCWLIVLQAVYPGRKTLEELHHRSPTAITAWRFRRLLKATSWNVHMLIEWLADDVIQALPAPDDGMLSVIGDGSHKDKRASKNPLAHKGRTSQHHPWFFGIRFALLVVAWDVYRLPAAFRLILPKRHPEYRTEHALFQDMLRQFKPPLWATLVIVAGDAAYGSKATIKLVKQRDKMDRSRHWHVVCAIARTWKTVDDQACKNLVQHLPRHGYQRAWIPRLSTWKHRKVSWVYATQLCLRDIGDVTLVLSKTGRNVSPAHTKRLVTNGALSLSTVTCNRLWAWANTRYEGAKTGLRSRLASPYWPTCLGSECVITTSHRENRGVCPGFSTAYDYT